MIVGGMLIGLLNADEMKERVAELKEIERILGYIVGEISCNHALLYEACDKVAARCRPPYSDWLQSLSYSLKCNGIGSDLDMSFDEDMPGGNGRSVAEIWNSSLAIFKQQGHLKADDLIALNAIGNTLGYLDIYSQQIGIDLEREHIHRHIGNLDKDLNNRMKVALAMGILGGILIVIFLI